MVFIVLQSHKTWERGKIDGPIDVDVKGIWHQVYDFTIDVKVSNVHHVTL